MTLVFQIIIVVLNVAVLGVCYMLYKRSSSSGSSDEIARLEHSLRDEIARNRHESLENERASREALNSTLKSFGDSLDRRMYDSSKTAAHQFDHFSQQLLQLTEKNTKGFDHVRESVETRLEKIQQDNSSQLEKMRHTVDEKLQSTLEKRLGESFKLVSDRLETVHKGLGEMQQLASGVGDLKKVLQNVKTRGTWGEVQLGNLLEQLLTTEQYARDVVVKPGSRERVDFALKIPSKDGDEGYVWLSIDSKFPIEDYERLVIASEAGDVVAVEESARALEQRLKLEAKSIRSKYIDPPNTTDFAILFLPIEGLYAEVLRRPGLAHSLQNEHRVVLAGPTTVAAILNSLQMGFRTLAIQKRSSEVWEVLGAVKSEFGKFAGILEKTQKQLQAASNTIETAASKTRTIERRLRKVEELPATSDSPDLLSSVSGDDSDT